MRKWIVFLLLIGMIACNDDVYYKHSFDVTESNWSYDQFAVFDFEINDLEVYYDLILDIEHDVDYVYENVYVKIHTTFPSGDKVSDEVSLQLADGLDQWEGRCSGTICKVSILLQNRIFFKEIGKHKIEIEQFNREEPLEGIKKLTLKIIELE